MCLNGETNLQLTRGKLRACVCVCKRENVCVCVRKREERGQEILIVLWLSAEGFKLFDLQHDDHPSIPNKLSLVVALHLSANYSLSSTFQHLIHTRSRDRASHSPSSMSTHTHMHTHAHTRTRLLTHPCTRTLTHTSTHMPEHPLARSEVSFSASASTWLNVFVFPF